MTENVKMQENYVDEPVSDVSAEPLTSDQSIEGENESLSPIKDADIANKSIYELLEADIMNSDLPLKEKNKRLSKLIRTREKQVNILLVGATGSGKSSTINALFNMDVAKVGRGVDPETDSITCYTLSNLIIWDTPGLGDSVDNDERYSYMLTRKLSETDEDSNMLIDLVLVVLDSSSRDLRTTIDLINDTIIPCMGNDAAGRILIGLNQADVAMKGTHWNSEANKPDETLIDFLEKKAESVRLRINDSTNLNIEPIYYCAGYTDENGIQRKPYNLAKLLYYIIKSIPSEKRIGIPDNLNSDEENWEYNDDNMDYGEEIRRSFFDTLSYYITDSASEGAFIGESALGIPGGFAGYIIGGLFGIGKGIYHGLVD